MSNDKYTIDKILTELENTYNDINKLISKINAIENIGSNINNNIEKIEDIYSKFANNDSLVKMEKNTEEDFIKVKSVIESIEVKLNQINVVKINTVDIIENSLKHIKNLEDALLKNKESSDKVYNQLVRLFSENEKNNNKINKFLDNSTKIIESTESVKKYDDIMDKLNNLETLVNNHYKKEYIKLDVGFTLFDFQTRSYKKYIISKKSYKRDEYIVLDYKDAFSRCLYGRSIGDNISFLNDDGKIDRYNIRKIEKKENNDSSFKDNQVKVNTFSSEKEDLPFEL